MVLEDIISKKIEVFNDICFGKKKKRKGKEKKSKKLFIAYYKIFFWKVFS